MPSKEYLPGLERNELLNGHINDINSNLGMEFVAHFTSSETVKTSEYQKFLHRINAKRHLVLNETNIFSGFKHVNLLQKTLNHLDADICPHLGYTFSFLFSLLNGNELHLILFKTPHFSSKFKSDRTIIRNIESANREVNQSEKFFFEPTTSGTRYIFSLNGLTSANELRNDADDEEEYSDSDSEDVVSDEETEVHIDTTRANAFPKVVFLGTGSSFPGPTKNVTAILVHTA